MSADEDDPAAPPEQLALNALTSEVKSRIIDRVLADLMEDRQLGLGASSYTKSDSGIYGKYQKQDVTLDHVLKAIQNQVEQIASEHREYGTDSPASDPKPEE